MPLPNRHPTKAILALADGTVFYGHSIGAEGHTTGEVVFNTSMSGYQEILTDPSYNGQLVMLTYPHIGNTGVNEEDVESSRIQAAGLIVKDISLVTSNFRSTQSLPDYLKAENIVAITGIDTRKLTRIIREKGAQSATIMTGNDVEKALELARACPGLSGVDLVQKVTTDKPYDWVETGWKLKTGYGVLTDPKYHVVAFDYGVKRNILRMLTDRGCKVTVLPAQSTAQDALALAPDGVFLSNGPGDPEPCTYAIETARELIDCNIPTFGICLGHQIMAMASGAKTMKMKFGHHGANHPVQDLNTGNVLITSQNHGFAVDPTSLPANCIITHLSLFDGTIQGLARTDKPAFCFQGHPEASPGPGDVGYLFDRFIDLIERSKGKTGGSASSEKT